MTLRVFLYDCPAANALRVHELADFLASELGDRVAVEVRPEFFAFTRPGAEVAARFAACKVRYPSKAPPESLAAKPLFQEVEYEKRRLAGKANAAGILYDGERYVAALRDLLPASEHSLDDVHLVVTNQLVGTYGEGDGRYHARVIVAGFPAVLSTTGLVEGPAKPREFYRAKARHQQMFTGVPVDMLADAFGDAILRPDDPRTTEALKGYAMMAVLHQATGEGFCPHEECALFNAHWQAELVRAQLGAREHRFCARHRALIASLGASSRPASPRAASRRGTAPARG